MLEFPCGADEAVIKLPRNQESSYSYALAVDVG